MTIETVFSTGSDIDATELQSRYEFARESAIAGGTSTLEFFQRSDIAVEKKGDSSPVTIADRNAEQLIRQRIEERFPDDAIIGEEFEPVDGTSGFKWIIDPIDGTKSFITGVPLYGTMVGVLHDERPVIGAIYFPGLDEGIYGLSGSQTVYGRGNDLKPARVADIDDLGDAIFLMSEAKTFGEVDAKGLYETLEQGCFVTRTWGDAYGYYLVATGRAHLMIDPILSIWDAAAVAPVLIGAGGRFADWHGLENIETGNAIGTVPGLFEQVIQLIRHQNPS